MKKSTFFREDTKRKEFSAHRKHGQTRCARGARRELQYPSGNVVHVRAGDGMVLHPSPRTCVRCVFVYTAVQRTDYFSVARLYRIRSIGVSCCVPISCHLRLAYLTAANIDRSTCCQTLRLCCCGARFARSRRRKKRLGEARRAHRPAAGGASVGVSVRERRARERGSS